jgi:hypothetical protein
MIRGRAVQSESDRISFWKSPWFIIGVVVIVIAIGAFLYMRGRGEPKKNDGDNAYSGLTNANEGQAVESQGHRAGVEAFVMPQQ